MKTIILYISFSFVNLCFPQVEMFEKGLISDNQVFGITMSPDGESVLFVKAFGGRDTLQLYQAKKINEKWQQPQLAFFSNTSVKQIDPSFSPDGNTILFNQLNSEENNYNVYRIDKTPNGWGKPKRLSNAINTNAHEFYATMSVNKNIYFTRRNNSNDIYVSYWIDNKYKEAIPLEGNINTEESESNPYISPNEDFIIFISTRKNGYGNADLYISFRKGTKWSSPINLGNKINTSVSEFCPTIGLKEKQFFFSRTIIENERRIENIYSVPLESLRINELKKQAEWN